MVPSIHKSVEYYIKNQCNPHPNPQNPICGEKERPILRRICSYKGFLVDQINFKKRNKVGGLAHSSLKMYYKTTVIKIMWTHHKVRQWKRKMESPLVDSHLNQRLMFNKIPRSFNR